MARPLRRRAFFGLFTRSVSVIIGVALAGGLVVAMQQPLMNQPSTSTTSPNTVAIPSATSIAWPSGGSAALVIPSLGVQRTWQDRVAPIASLTKLMTAYVVLERLPLVSGASGPCLTVTSADVLNYDAMVATNQSSAAVARGEVLCESTLLDGLLIHSANNFATLLANLTWGGTTAFVARMNAEALALGLTHTHYADVSGYDAGSVSTALDQGRLASLLMQSPLVRAIVDQSSVTLPVAGTLGSYTPFVGVDNVVGVKSGRTNAAGGCDVMAMTFELNGRSHLAYAVVLGARGGDLLGPAGNEALAIEQSVLNSVTSLHLARGAVVGTLGWNDHRTNVVVSAPLTVQWFTALHTANVSVSIDAERRGVVPGDVVGWLDLNEGTPHRVALTVARAVAPPTLIQRLR
ncbi:MAG: D-alanyl-D-alanine carboxypeptidase [Acidobacteria bacterium]|nr:D-alanyl-D-alanine carboxypeptidase [Acidobacteriota bacterium]